MVERPSLAGVALNVRSPQALAAFYVRHLGMRSDPIGEAIEVGYGGQGACLRLLPSPSPEPYRHATHDRYWKIGITLPDLDPACRRLKAEGVQITQPRQFEDVGYLCHAVDPEGFQIELLQHTFEGCEKTAFFLADLPLGGGARIGQITLRTTDISADLDHYRTELGMKLLSIQPVRRHGFDLYFLAATDEEPPDPDVNAVANRPWLWQRRYTTLEFTHRLEPDAVIRQPNAGDSGYAGLIIHGSDR